MTVFSNSMFGTVRARAMSPMVSTYSPSAGKYVLDAHAAARAEGHAVLVALLVARAGGGRGGQRQDHVGGGAIGGLQRHGLRIAHRLQRQRARAVTAWSMNAGVICSSSALVSKSSFN